MRSKVLLFLILVFIISAFMPTPTTIAEEIIVGGITINGSDTYSEINLLNSNIPTNSITITDIFLSNSDFVKRIDLLNPNIPTYSVPIDEIFISITDAAYVKDQKNPFAQTRAQFAVDETSGNAPLTVTFIDLSIGATSWNWNFGDETTSTEQNPSHTYIEPGNYSVNLTVTNSVDMSDTLIRENYITVEALVEPIPDFSVDLTSGKLPLTVSFTDSSTDAVSWSWDFDNDGVVDDTVQNPVHLYTEPGTYSVNLTVTSEDGLIDSLLREAYITVEQIDPPVAEFEANQTSGVAPMTVQFTELSTGDPTEWSWDCDNDSVIDSTEQNPSFTYEVPGTYTVTLVAANAGGSDEITKTDCILVTSPNSPPIADANGPYTATEGTVVTFDASGSSDPDGDALLFRWDVNTDDVWETAWTSDPLYMFTWHDDFTGTATVEVSDGELNTTATAEVTVSNEPPTVSIITVPVDPVQVNTEITASAEFTDQGTLDTHAAVWDWGDDASTEGVMTEADGAGNVTGTHTYTVPGVYTINLTVTDDEGASVSEIYQYVVVYDPNGGFVTGGGWIASPPGAYAPDPTLTGKATFGFVSKYKKGATLPTGQTEFQFKVADLNFHSESYDWLVIAGSKAKYKGTGTINGEGEYKFMLSAIDGDLKDNDKPDMFRIKIWDKTTEELVYDNQLDAPDDADPTTELGGGSIVVHKSK
jgi:PKD repeat protein